MAGLLHKLRHPQRSYVICALPRSGSNLLGDGLADTHLAGRPKQYFLPEFEERYSARYSVDATDDYAAYVRRVISETATHNEVFGFKLMSFYLDQFLRRLRETGEFGDASTKDVDLLRAAFPRLHFVHLVRRNKLRQAISRARAMQTGVWKIAGAESEPMAAPTYNAELIRRCLRDGEREEAIWARFFGEAGAKSLTVEYEQLCENYGAGIAAVLEFVGVDIAGAKIPAPRTVRQGDEISEDWYARYRAETGQPAAAAMAS